MAASTVTTKRSMIDKSNATVVLVTGVAAFITVFCLVATKTLVSQAAYQNKVLKAKHTAVVQLRGDLKATEQLKKSYDTFVGADPNVIGGSKTGKGAQDGDNGKIVLDSLPSSYDFPALATSLEKIVLGTNGLTIQGITGTDDEIKQAGNQSSSSPQPVPMPFQLTVTGNYQTIQDLIGKFESSIRPFQIQDLIISGDQTNLTLTMTAQTFYQPAKSLNIKTTVVQ